MVWRDKRESVRAVRVERLRMLIEHLVMRCAHAKEERGKLMELMDERVEGWLSVEENERVAIAMDKACTDPAVGRAMERLWRKRFT